MFNSILTAITGYFDKRTLMSTFFPSLVFWGLMLAVFFGTRSGLESSFTNWDARSTSKTATFVMLLTFFVWVTFWSFLTSNFRPALMRFYQGNWQIVSLENWRRRVWQRRYSQLEDEDFELEQQGIAVGVLGAELKKLRAGITDNRPPAIGADAGVQFDKFLRELGKFLQEQEPPDSARFQVQITEARTWQKAITPEEPPAAEARTETPAASGPIVPPPPPSPAWTQRRALLAEFMDDLQDLQPRVDETRARFAERFVQYYPPAAYVMPTQLGNVMKTVEVRVRQRYGLDVVAIWSRLQTELPKEFAEILQDAKMALDLMITLTTFILVFGGLAAAWFSRHWSIEVVATAPFILVVALPLIWRWVLNYSFEASIEILFGAFTLLLWIPFVVIDLMLTYGFSPFLIGFGNAVVRVEFFVVLMTAVCFAAWLVYLTAVQASLGYAERLQASFDLYRWKVFDSFHLQLPASFAEEQRMWDEISALLSSSRPPSANYFKYLKDTKTKDVVAATVTVPVLRAEKAALTKIEASDLVDGPILESKLVADTLRRTNDIVDHILLHKVAANEPIRRSEIVDTATLEDKVAVGIPANAAMTLGNALESGNRIDVLIAPPPTPRPGIRMSPAATLAGSPESPAPPEPASAIPAAPPIVRFDDLLVLAVNKTSESAFVVVVALPTEKWQQFATASVNSTIAIARRAPA